MPLRFFRCQVSYAQLFGEGLRRDMSEKIAFDLGFTYNERKKPSLTDVKGRVEAGDFIVLCGCSGCGKSSLLRCINHLVPAFYEGKLKGFCMLNGKDISDFSIGDVGRQASSVFQDPRSQFFTLNSSSELAFGLENFGFSHEEMVKRVKRGFEKFGLLHLMDRGVFELSGGERQLIAILSAWALDTDIILMDEPTANLDQSAIVKLREMLRELKADGKTVIVSEHRLYYLAGLADEYWYMDEGTIAKRFSSQEMLQLKEEELTEMGLRMPEIRDVVLRREDPNKSGAEESSEIKVHTLCCEGITFRYKGAKESILKNAQLSLKTGEAVALAGPNGNGKTTLGKVLCGIFKPAHGQVFFDDKAQGAKELQNKSIFVMQEAEFQFFTNSVWNELKYGRKITEPLKDEMEKMLKLSGLWKLRNRHPFTLSGGQMQKLVLLMAYFTEKPVAILDEPTAGLDGRSLRTCIQIINEIRQRKIVLIITHDLELIAGVCTKCVWLENGSVKDCFTLDSDEMLHKFREYRDCRLETAKKMFSPVRRKRIFDPRIKLVIMLCCCVTSVFVDTPLVTGMFAAGMLINIYESKYKSSFMYAVVYAALLFPYLLFPNAITTLLMNLIPRFIVIWQFMTAVVSNDGGGKTLAAFRFLRMPERVIMVFAVMFRFIPVLDKDLSLMRQSVQTRGFFSKFTDKILALPEYMEILIAPLMLRVIRIAEALSASAETRGIALTGRRQSYIALKIGAADLLITAAVVIFIGFGFFYAQIIALF